MKNRFAPSLLLMLAAGLYARPLTAAETMTAEEMKQTLKIASGNGGSIGGKRMQMFEQLIALGPAAAEALADDVGKRLADPKHGGYASEYLIRLAGGFGERGVPCVPGLAAVVVDKISVADPDEAIVALGQIGPAARVAVPQLIEAGNADAVHRNMEAARALAAIGGPEAKAALTDWSTGGKAPLKAVALWELSTMDPADAHAADQRRAAIDVAADLFNGGRGINRDDVSTVFAVIGPQAADIVIPSLEVKSSRGDAIRALYAMQTGLNGRDIVNRNKTYATPLQRLRDLPPASTKRLAEHLPIMLAVAGDDDVSGDYLAEILATVFPDNQDAFTAIVKRLRHCDGPTDRPINALVMMGKKALPALLERYKSTPKTEPTRAWLMAALLRIDPKSVPDLSDALNKPLPLGFDQMAEILRYAGDDGATVIASAAGEDKGTSDRSKLDYLPPGESSIVAVMAQLAKADDLRASALADALQRVSRPQDLGVLVREIKKLPPRRQEDAMNALVAQMGGNFNAAQTYSGDPIPIVRRAAVPPWRRS